ncbi:MAG TPA: AI-2E family transporter [Gemmatimonadales bacterium]|nr:AI-2E family transporter [Gemmatimonadales bacterium]
MNASRVTAVALAVIAVIIVAVVLSSARVVFAPIALAMVFAAILRPVIRHMERWRLPAPLASTLLLLAMVAALSAAVSALSEPAQEWMAKAPRATAIAGRKLRALRHQFDWIGNAVSPPPKPTVQTLPVGPDSSAATVVQVTTPPAAPDYGPMLSRAFGTTTEVVSGIVTMVLLLFFLLAGGRTWRDRLIKVAPSRAEGERFVQIVHEIQQVVARYFFASLLINIGQGLLVGLAMWGVGMPSPMAWGILTVFAEFLPYVGGFVMVLLLALVGLSVSDSLAHALIAPGLYLLITTLQNNLVSPLVYGRGLRLHPVPILIAVAVGWFIWGVPGAFLAVPVLGGLSVLCRNVEGWSGLGEFLAD